MREKEIENIKNIQKELSEIIGVSGNEKPVVEFVQKKIEGLVDKIWVDSLGSLLAVKEGTDKKERIMLDAHVDEIGFMISYIESKGGFLRFVPIGGWDDRTLLGKSVKILSDDGKEFHGIIGSKPPHLTSESERKNPIQIKDLYIDAGFKTKEEVEEQKIHIGSFGTLYDPFIEFPNDLIRGKAFDDRTGVNILIQIIKEFSEKDHPNTLLFSFSTFEEVGGRGAATTTYSLDPTMAIAIENTTAADVPDIKDSDCPAYINKGPAITVADRSMIANPMINKRLIENAKYENIPFHIKKPIYGGTNAGRIHQTRKGVPTSVVSVPCRYIHSSTSLLSLNDIYHTTRLVSAFVRNPAKIL